MRNAVPPPRLLPVWRPRRRLFTAAAKASVNRSSPCDIEAADSDLYIDVVQPRHQDYVIVRIAGRRGLP